ncbi:hypothetical protein SBD_0205 [Streptomyces bottropensis ATCC 25435]|uniref:Uncharacterized protein n=1 Tax=Streptomyces bottropensis ATCC 25435 TaxID=1054862 RepID=M3F7B7_9ACTN|nr:hypothetical protein SBD_0205 [Streptomyces bottropensis ATCC 25435]
MVEAGNDVMAYGGVTHEVYERLCESGRPVATTFPHTPLLHPHTERPTMSPRRTARRATAR